MTMPFETSAQPSLHHLNEALMALEISNGKEQRNCFRHLPSSVFTPAPRSQNTVWQKPVEDDFFTSLIMLNGIWTDRKKPDNQSLPTDSDDNSYLNGFNAALANETRSIVIGRNEIQRLDVLIFRTFANGYAGRLRITLEESSRLLLVLDSKTSVKSGVGIFSDRVEIFVKKNAHLDLIYSHEGSQCGTGIMSEIITLEEGASVTGLHLLAGQAHRHLSDIRLCGEGSRSHMTTLLLADPTGIGHRAEIHHLAKGTVSVENQRTLLSQGSTAWSEAFTNIVKGAQLSNATQNIKQIYLGETARGFMRPELVIEADDVECVHGATTGTLDPDVLFYLGSRGLSPSAARNLLLKTYADEFADLVRASVGPYKNASKTPQPDICHGIYCLALEWIERNVADV